MPWAAGHERADLVPLPRFCPRRSAIGTLLDERLVACGNILPGMTSLYVWQGERHRDSEVGVLLKTDATLLEAAITRLSTIHPYETPAILGWRCDAAAPATAAWLGALAG
jgi:periplasmic divalent cation tolerance protein